MFQKVNYSNSVKNGSEEIKARNRKVSEESDSINQAVSRGRLEGTRGILVDNQEWRLREEEIKMTFQFVE